MPIWFEAVLKMIAGILIVITLIAIVVYAGIQYGFTAAATAFSVLVIGGYVGFWVVVYLWMVYNNIVQDIKMKRYKNK